MEDKLEIKRKRGRKASPEKETKKRNFLEILKKNLGNASKTVEETGIDWIQYYAWKNKDRDFQNELKYIQEEVVPDHFEQEAIELVQEKRQGAAQVIMFMLNSKAKHRGYSYGKQAEEKEPKPKDMKKAKEMWEKTFGKMPATSPKIHKLNVNGSA